MEGKEESRSFLFLKDSFKKSSFFIFISFLIVIIASSLTLPICQGWFVYMNLPWHWFIDFTKPHLPQLYFEGLKNTSNIRIQSTDGVELGVWHTKPKIHSNVLKGTKKKRVVLYLHGNGESRAYLFNSKKYTFYSSMPISSHVISFDYRGFGDSTGFPTEHGLYDDAFAVWSWITGKLNFSSSEVIIHGHSLGSGVATHLARVLCQFDSCPGAVILEAPFTSVLDAAEHLFPFTSRIRSTLNTIWYHKFPSIENIPDIKCPVIILHGRNDDIIPSYHSEKLFEVMNIEQNSTSINLTDIPLKSRHIYLREKSSIMLLESNSSHGDLIESSEVRNLLRSFWNILE